MPRQPRQPRQPAQGDSTIQPINWLDLALSYWEDSRFKEQAETRIALAQGLHPGRALSGDVAHWRQVRDDFLRLHQNKPWYTGLTQFEPAEGIELVSRIPEGHVEHHRYKILLDDYRFIWELAAWRRNSGRIYRINREVQAVLRCTSLKGVVWEDVIENDIRLPSQSFGIELEEPVVGADGHQTHFLLVNHWPEKIEESPIHLGFSGQRGTVLSIRAFGQFGNARERHSSYQPISEAGREEVGALISSRQFPKALRKLGELWGSIPGPLLWSVVLPVRADLEVTNTGGIFRDLEHPEAYIIGERAEVMARIIAGLALYLKSLPVGSPHLSPPAKPLRSGLPDRKIITSGWEVCNVTSTIAMTRQERIFFGIEGTPEEQRQARYELCCHFREAHWRRRRGEGHIAHASKCVHVGWAFVRRDRLPGNGGLPGVSVKGD